jgi:uncharacterized metal-binding protein YceD (DUF177 family)
MRQTYSEPILELRHLVHNRGVDFDLIFLPIQIADVITQLDLITLKKPKFSGCILPLGEGDWILTAELGATVEQPCSVTLEPVQARIQTNMSRTFRKSPIELSVGGSEYEMPKDDTEEQLAERINLFEFFIEGLSLELEDYPKVNGIQSTKVEYAPPGVTPLTDESARPFAVLAEFKEKLKD